MSYERDMEQEQGELGPRRPRPNPKYASLTNVDLSDQHNPKVNQRNVNYHCF